MRDAVCGRRHMRRMLPGGVTCNKAVVIKVQELRGEVDARDAMDEDRCHARASRMRATSRVVPRFFFGATLMGAAAAGQQGEQGDIPSMHRVTVMELLPNCCTLHGHMLDHGYVRGVLDRWVDLGSGSVK